MPLQDIGSWRVKCPESPCVNKLCLAEGNKLISFLSSARKPAKTIKSLPSSGLILIWFPLIISEFFTIFNPIYVHCSDWVTLGQYWQAVRIKRTVSLYYINRSPKEKFNPDFALGFVIENLMHISSIKIKLMVRIYYSKRYDFAMGKKKKCVIYALLLNLIHVL